MRPSGNREYDCTHESSGGSSVCVCVCVCVYGCTRACVSARACVSVRVCHWLRVRANENGEVIK